MSAGSAMRVRLAAGLLATTMLGSCATTTAGGDSAAAKPPIEDPPARPGAKTVLIAMPHARDFADARKGLVAELEHDFNVTTLVVSASTTEDELAAAIQRARPICLVLMNNSTLKLFHAYQRRPGISSVPPAVVLMASFLEETRPSIRGITGIAYEVPAVTAFINLRTIVTRPINRVGVVYRPAFGHFIEQQKALAAREHIDLVPTAVSANVTAEELRSALRTLAKRDRVDALWMLNDNGLIRDGAFVAETWRPVLDEVSLPLVVGVPNLVDPNQPVGTLAAVPDHEALGFQAANLIFDLADNAWNVAGHAIELPLSVKTVVDVSQVRRRFGLKSDALQHIDRPLELEPRP